MPKINVWTHIYKEWPYIVFRILLIHKSRQIFKFSVVRFWEFITGQGKFEYNKFQDISINFKFLKVFYPKFQKWPPFHGIALQCRPFEDLFFIKYYATTRITLKKDTLYYFES